MALRPYQQDAIDQLREGIRHGYLTQMLMASTGSGKTKLASAIQLSACLKGRRTMFIVDSLELVDQAARTFTSEGMSVGVIQGNHEMTDYRCQVQVATIQTLRNRWPNMAESMKPNLVIIDEAHVIHSQHEVIIAECREKNVPVIGLSATPFRDGLGKIFDRLVTTVTTRELMDMGYLSPYRCFAPYIPDLKGIKTTNSGDWAEDALAEVMGDSKLVGDIVENWLKLADGRQTIVFASNVAHSRAICDAFTRCGIAAAHIDGYERDAEARTATINSFRSGEITVLCNVACLTKGFDSPEVSCLVIARPTKSLMLHIQILGRGLRIAPGKQECIIIDHAGNCIRNGMPDSPLPTELDMGDIKHNLDRREREEKTPVESACGSCGFVSTKHQCPSCGFKPERRQDVEVVDGDLYEIKEDVQTKNEWTTEKLAGLYSELLGYARAKGYKDGWAWNQCREYVGRAPRNTKQLGASQPSDDTMRIIKHLQIRNAKRRATA